VFAEVFDPSGKAVAGGSRVAYDTTGAGTYTWRVCSEYQQQSPPRFNYNALLGTGPAAQPVLVGPEQPQPPAGGVLGARTTIGATLSGKVAIRVRAGLAWFTVGTASNGTTTLRVYNPMKGTTRIVKGETAIVSGKTVRITGHGVRLVLTKSGMGRATYSSSTFKAQGRVVRGHFQIKV
jgi:hypothetical protein